MILPPMRTDQEPAKQLATPTPLMSVLLDSVMHLKVLTVSSAEVS